MSEEAEPLAGRGWLGSEEGENLRKHPNVEELISEEFTIWGLLKPLRVFSEAAEATVPDSSPVRK